MARDPLAWLPLLQHWTGCLGEGGEAIGRMGDLGTLPQLDLAALVPGGPGWGDVQRCLCHDPEGAFRVLYYGLALRGLEPLPAPELLVAEGSAEYPRITVLIPVHNHWPLTLNCLRSLTAMANGTSFEVIVADDASSDATTQLGRQLPWLRIWRSERNHGFLHTCNGAATLARGEVLLLLNNDTLVGDHALDQLWRSLERHPEAGVVGAAAWGVDGRPQEVGGIVWADGQVWNHGRGFPPEYWFALAYERQCDYVSGCALAIRRALWKELGGFDARYRPAYCEDTDLCLRVWESGRMVLVQPRARILHLEGLSHSRDASQGLKRHQLRNLEQLRERWQSRLDLHQPPAGMPWLLAADPQLRRRPAALLAAVGPAELGACLERGYQPLLLDGEAEAEGFCRLPAHWPQLEEWLAEQLAQPWCKPPPRVRSAAELPKRAAGRWPPALVGWERRGVRLLASSRGLHGDGWLECGNRLVVEVAGGELAARPRALRIDLFLPGDADLIAPPAVGLSWGEAPPELWRLQRGLNSRRLHLPEGCPPVLVLELRGSALVRPSETRDERQLLAVLADLAPVPGPLTDEQMALGQDHERGTRIGLGKTFRPDHPYPN